VPTSFRIVFALGIMPGTPFVTELCFLLFSHFTRRPQSSAWRSFLHDFLSFLHKFSFFPPDLFVSLRTSLAFLVYAVFFFSPNLSTRLTFKISTFSCRVFDRSNSFFDIAHNPSCTLEAAVSPPFVFWSFPPSAPSPVFVPLDGCIPGAGYGVRRCFAAPLVPFARFVHILNVCLRTSIGVRFFPAVFWLSPFLLLFCP